MDKIELMNEALKDLGEVEIKAKQSMLMAGVIARLQKVGQALVNEAKEDE